MEEKTNLIPGRRYLIKCVTGANIVVLECEFIKYYNNQYFVPFVQYNEALIAYNEGRGDPPQFPEELVGTILNEDYNQSLVDAPNFDDELYPYYRYRIGTPLTPYIGLFRFIRVVTIVYNGATIVNNGELVPAYAAEYGPDMTKYGHVMFKPFRINAYVDTSRTLTNNVTRMWVNLDKVNLSIRPKLDKEKMLQEKGVEAFAQRLPEYVKLEIKDKLGGKRKSNTQKKGKGRRKITKRKITKGKKRRSKTLRR